MSAMEPVALGRTELSVSPLCLGAMNFGSPIWGCDEDAAGEILRTYREAGGNFIDTANIYALGESERILRRLLAGSRAEFVLASKVGFPYPPGAPSGLSSENIRASLQGTLSRLGTDYLDLYQLHAFDPTVGLEETLGALDSLVEEGLIRAAGSSNFFAWQIAHANAIAQGHEFHRLVSAQMMYNLIRRDIEREHLGYAKEVGLAVIAYGPLHGGHLAAGWQGRSDLPSDSRAVDNPDVYLADEARVFSVTSTLIAHAHEIGATPGQVALAWVMRNPAITVTLTAARSATELETQLGALTLDADDAFWESLDAATVMEHSYPRDFYDRLSGRG